MKTPPHNDQLVRLEYLLELVLDGSCTDEQRQEFSQLLDQNPQIVPDLTEEVFVHSLLTWQGEEDKARLGFASELEAGSELNADANSESDLEEDPPVQSPTTNLPAENLRAEVQDSLRNLPSDIPTTDASVASSFGWGLALAAALLLAVGFGVSNFLDLSSPAEPLSVARVVQSENVVWSETSTARTVSGEIMPGRLETVSGQVTLEFRAGPVVRLDGPSSLMIESEMMLHLDRGQATARVPEHLTGFTIRTPVVSVIDQGTEFGVATRSNGHTDVVVFDGQVDLQDGISVDAEPTRLVQGEAARVDRLGSLQRLMQISMNSGGTWWTNDYPINSANLIKEVRDNIPPEDGSKYFCYQITHGLKEDSFAFSDHPHQLNGVSAEGLPSMLVGADYVKTFNDYRYMFDFEMEVSLERPANLYVLFDDRVPPPVWLTSQFTDTGVDVGLDEGPWPEGDKALRPDLPTFENGVGPGASIDNSLSVWHRVCAETTPISLGSMGPSAGARAMYVVAATPLGGKRVAQFRNQVPTELKLASAAKESYNAFYRRMHQ